MNECIILQQTKTKTFKVNKKEVLFKRIASLSLIKSDYFWNISQKAIVIKLKR